MSTATLHPIQRPGDSDERLRLWHAPRGATLLEIIAAPAASHPDLTALSFSTDGRTCETLSWRALWEGALSLGQRLSAARTMEREPVLLITPTSPAFFHGFFAILAAGGVPVPVATPTSLNPSRLGWYQELVTVIAADAGARMVLTTARYAAVLEACLATSGLRVVAIDHDPPHQRSFDVRPVHVEPQDVAMLQYTSGSTSSPKGVVLSHGNIVANVGLIAAAVATSDAIGVSWLPLYHDMGLIGAALTALYARRPLLLMPTPLFVKEPASWLRAISAFGATTTLAPNFAFQHAVRHVSMEQLPGTSLHTLETALNGAEPVDASAVAAFEQKFAAIGLRPGSVRPVYGLAESSLAVTFSDPGELIVDEVDAARLEEQAIAVPASEGPRVRRFVSVGRPLPTQDVRIVDSDDRLLPERHIGEVIVRGPSVMLGYYGRPAETAIALRGGFLHTGDLGYLAEGRLYLTGRSRELIIRYGRNYYPADIEAVITRIEGTNRGAAVVFGVEEDGSTRVVVVVETRLRRAHELALLERTIRDQCHAAFLFGPDDVRMVPLGGIPRTTSGKLRRDYSRRLYLAAALPEIASTAAPTSTHTSTPNSTMSGESGGDPELT